ncbi:hypothetical protein SASPL_112423 [Salvia splendens]|uniref:DUF4218 domain-containing protein n=1 Tax=Salvia splendens TaxID=180675 RepID=A0A8X9A4K1_SALSN|nr:hypothetical protein SASPL_112423 [Salvia splendens]
MSHPADSVAWKTFDQTHPFFASESRNIKLALSTDGFQPFSQTGSQYSLWPVILTPYNLPPLMCMKDPYMFLNVVVPGPRLRRLYACEVTAQSMRWHAEHTQTPGKMSHSADSVAWKTFDQTHPFFASESRNVRLTLSTDGFQPFGQTGSQYSLWPVILTPYNLPPWMCMKDPYMFLTVIVPGPKNPKQNIDVFLQPLIAELNDLWAEGIQVYDISRKQNFQLRAALMWTISDFPAYSMLPGWSTSGHRAYPYCMEDSQDFSLKHGRKTTWFDCHGRFLHMNHRFRRDKKNFRMNRMEHSGPPLILNREQILYHHDQFGFKRVFDEDVELVNSELSKILEKNVFDNIFNTTMDVDGKTKDNANAGRDLEVLGIRPELWPRGGKYHKVAFTLEKESKELFLKWLNSLKFPDGYVSNLSRCIDMKKHKLYDMKSHDCHVFMQRLLPIGLRELLPRVVREPLTELSNFLSDLTATVIREVDMIKYNESIALTLCKLEMIFPPSFFDSMEHLPVHLAYEALIAGPSHVRCRGRDVPHNDDGGGSTHPEDTLSIFTYDIRCAGKGHRWFLSEMEYKSAQTCILVNTTEANEFEIHLYHLSQGPLKGVMSYNICFVNGYKFHTDSDGKSRSTVNSGVCIRGSNYSYADDDFYGILKEVVEVEYRASPIKKVVLFNCAWYNPAPPPRGGIIVHPKFRIVEVNIHKEYPKYDPFVLAQQASQIYFVSFPSKKKDKVNWRAVLKVRAEKFDASYAITKEADEDTAFQEDGVEIHEISDDMEFVEPSRHDPSGETPQVSLLLTLMVVVPGIRECLMRIDLV